MEFNKNTPIYVQIIENIKEDLISGKLKQGEKLPSVRELSKKLKVNPTTIQRVYRELESLGLTYTERGMGSYVTNDKGVISQMKLETAARLTNAYIEKMKHMGFEEEAVFELIKKEWREGK